MSVFGKMSLVVKLALVAGLSMALMAAVMIFAILEISVRKSASDCGAEGAYGARSVRG